MGDICGEYKACSPSMSELMENSPSSDGLTGGQNETSDSDSFKLCLAGL